VLQDGKWVAQDGSYWQEVNGVWTYFPPNGQSGNDGPGGGTGGPLPGTNPSSSLPVFSTNVFRSLGLGDPTRAFGQGTPTVGSLPTFAPYRPYQTGSGYGAAVNANPIGSQQGGNDPYAELLAEIRFGLTPEEALRQAQARGQIPGIGGV
jgi:hypothetical protein